MRSIIKFGFLGVIVCTLSCTNSTNNENKDESPLEAAETEMVEEAEASKIILFFGNSLTAGLGLDQKEAFPALIDFKLDSLGLDYEVINAGLSGETTASGKNRLNWVLNQKVDVFVLELGANDGLRGISLDETRKNLQAIIDAVKEKNSSTEIVLAGMQIPPNMGEEYTSEFRNLYTDLRDKNKIYLIPFLLDGVAGNPDLNLPDGIHPTVEGHKIVANNVWAILENICQ